MAESRDPNELKYRALNLLRNGIVVDLTMSEQHGIIAGQDIIEFEIKGVVESTSFNALDMPVHVAPGEPDPPKPKKKKPKKRKVLNGTTRSRKKGAAWWNCHGRGLAPKTRNRLKDKPKKMSTSKSRKQYMDKVSDLIDSIKGIKP